MIYREYLKAKNQNSIKFKEVEGPSPLSIFHSKGRDLKNYQIYGNSTQKTTGKNLISSLPYYNPIPDDNFHVIFEAGKAYTFSFESSTSSKWRLMIWGTELDGSDLNVGSNGYLQGMYCSAAAPNRLQDSADRTTNSYTYLCNKSFVAVRIAFWNTDNGASDTITNPQLELGSTATEYEAYHTSPSPEFPSEVESVGEFTTKNLLPNDWEEGFISTSSGANQNSSTYVRTKDYFAFDISKNYYISSDSIDTSATISWYFYDENKNFIRRFVSYKNRTIGTSGCQVTIPTNTVFFRLAVLTTDINIKVQLELGSTATAYEPYHKYDVPISIYGKNLIKYPYQYTTRDVNGIRFTDNGDGSVTMNGKATANAVWFMYLNRTNLIGGLSSGDKITLSVKSNKSFSGALRVVCNYFDTGGTEKDANMSITAANSSRTNRITALWKGMEIYIVVLKGQTVDNITIYPQLEKGSPATSYEPYKGKTTTHIYLDEPLRKVGDYADYIDFKNQKVVRQIKEVAFDGTETWVYQESSNIIYLSIKNNNLSRTFDSFSTHFLFQDSKNAIDPYFVVVNSSTLGNVVLRLCQRSNNIIYSTADEFKTFLANQYNSGNPVKLLCNCYNVVEESITVPSLKLPKSEKATMMVDTTVKPSNIYAKYIRM